MFKHARQPASRPACSSPSSSPPMVTDLQHAHASPNGDTGHMQHVTQPAVSVEHHDDGGRSAYGHVAGEPFECVCHVVQLVKQRAEVDGVTVYKVGFKIGGGLDQDPQQSPNAHRYPDAGVYITAVEEDSPAQRAGLRPHDKLLQVNGYDLTMVTHAKAVRYIKQDPELTLLVARNDMPARLARKEVQI